MWENAAMSTPSRATSSRYWPVVLTRPERARLKRWAGSRGISGAMYGGLVLRWFLENPFEVPLVPLKDREE